MSIFVCIFMLIYTNVSHHVYQHIEIEERNHLYMYANLFARMVPRRQNELRRLALSMTYVGAVATVTQSNGRAIMPES